MIQDGFLVTNLVLLILLGFVLQHGSATDKLGTVMYLHSNTMSSYVETYYKA